MKFTTLESAQEAYEMEAQENSNIRKILLKLCCGLPKEKIAEVAAELKGKTFEEGGIIKDGYDEIAEEYDEMKRLVVKVADHMQKAIDAPGAAKVLDEKIVVKIELKGDWFFVADNLASKCREFEEKPQRGRSLHEMLMEGKV